MADGDRQSFVQRTERGPREGGPREGGPREGGNRDAGGFRIRLSDNEMRSARAVQEAFGVRSTVAALGLSLRTVAQLLEEGKLDEVVAQHRANAGSRPGGGDGGGGDRRGPRPERGERPAGGNRPNPFARPARPAAPQPVLEEPAVVAAAEEEPLVDTAEVATEAAAEAAAEAAPDASSEA
ncbi:MAG: hypothetical protein EB136_01220 [Synechococcaceae bacterium WBB_3_034]|nr:hypothetical protein [Synechococcaceae bacterium WBB_3_034]